MHDLEHILEHTGWDGLRGASLFVTGGTGFLGSWLTKSFALANERLGLNARMTVLSRNPSAHAQDFPGVTFLEGDVRTFPFPKEQFSHVIHAATDADAALIKEQPELTEETIVEGTKRTLEYAKNAGAGRFLFLSSGAVYGAAPALQVTEDAQPVADSPLYATYARGKRTAEALCCEADCVTTIARCFTFCGPNIPLEKHYAIGNFLRDAVKGGPIMLTGDPRTIRSYLSTADAAVWLWTILLKGETNRAYNVGSEKAYSLEEVAKLVAQVAGTKTGVQITQQPDPESPVHAYVPSNARIRQELGATERIGLEEQIKRTLDALCR